MLLATTYFGPVQWYTKLYRCAGQCVEIEANETFIKQTYRNRCIIATTNGPLQLTIPVTHSAEGDKSVCHTLISDHGNWRHLHWQAIKTAYGESAFFEYYEDDIRPFFIADRPDAPALLPRLIDYNMEAAKLMCRLLDIDVTFKLTESFTPLAENDLRYDIRPKNAPQDPDFIPAEYYQVYRSKHGFLPNMSILDLLFNEGPQAIITLDKSSAPAL